MRFLDREDAGRQLARLLDAYRKEDPLVLGLPRGGVSVAWEVATTLSAPLDVWVVRKIGAPGFPELAVGAVAEGGVVFLNEQEIDRVGASYLDIQNIAHQTAAEIAGRVRLFRGDRPPPIIAGRTVILVDEGIATGSTARAAIHALHLAGAARIVLAVPVAASQALREIAPLVNDIVCVYATATLYAVGSWYDEFPPVPDDDVLGLLESARVTGCVHAAHHAAVPGLEHDEVIIPMGDVELDGTLSGPAAPKGLVLIPHGCGQPRCTTRNCHVAAVLHRYGLATLSFDLLTREEDALDRVPSPGLETAFGEADEPLRSDFDLLAHRLVQVTDWVLSRSDLGRLPLACLGAGTGAAAALVAAARRPECIGAIVSCGGRPELAWDCLPDVHAATLLLVGAEDRQVIDINLRAGQRLGAPNLVELVPRATGRFEAPGTLDAAARLAGEWISEHLAHPVGGLLRVG